MLGVLSVSTPLRSALFGNMLTSFETGGLFQGGIPPTLPEIMEMIGRKKFRQKLSDLYVLYRY